MTLVLHTVILFLFRKAPPTPFSPKQNKNRCQFMSIIGHHFVKPKNYLRFSPDIGLGRLRGWKQSIDKCANSSQLSIYYQLKKSLSQE